MNDISRKVEPKGNANWASPVSKKVSLDRLPSLANKNGQSPIKRNSGMTGTHKNGASPNTTRTKSKRDKNQDEQALMQ